MMEAVSDFWTFTINGIAFSLCAGMAFALGH